VHAVDYSWARPDPQALRAAGYTVALRYLGTGARDISRAELDRLHAAGIAVGLIWETTAQRPLAGYAAGRSDARRANEFAGQLGAPGWLPVFYAVDFPASDAQTRGEVAAYFEGCRSVPGRPVAAYGHYGVIEYLCGVLGITHGWQCAGWSGPGTGSGGSYVNAGDGSRRRLSRHACMFQEYGGVRVEGTDHNAVFSDAAAWAWHPNAAAPDTPETAPSMEDLMSNPIHLPDHTGDAQWHIVTDGYGRLRRRFLSGDDMYVLTAAGLLGSTMVLTGHAADVVVSYPEITTPHTADGGAYALALNVIAYVKDRTDALAAQLAELIGRPPADVDESSLAEILAGLIDVVPGPQLTAEDIVELIEGTRLTVTVPDTPPSE
jgi:hypothetical protein